MKKVIQKLMKRPANSIRMALQLILQIQGDSDITG